MGMRAILIGGSRSSHRTDLLSGSSDSHYPKGILSLKKNKLGAVAMLVVCASLLVPSLAGAQSANPSNSQYNDTLTQINAGNPITITDPDMTRFMMTLDDAVDLVLYAFEHGNSGDIFVQKAPAATLETLARALVELLGKPDHPIRIIGTRHGEKKHEALLSREEMAHAQDLGEYFRVPPDLRDLNYGKFVEQGEQRISGAEDYTSANTQRLDVEGMKRLLLKLDFIRDLVAGRPAVPVD